MKYKEIEYNQEAWDLIFPHCQHTGSSLHCDEWIGNYLGATYRLIECSGNIRMIEILEQ